MPLFFLLFFFQHFNSRPHGGRQVIPPDPATERHFNSRPHGGRLFRPSGMVGSSLFQLTPSRRATRFFHSSAPPKPFQLTPSRRATNSRSTSQGFRLFQRTPSRRATIRPPFLQLHCVISTHALTEGDKCAHHHQSSDTISTHALTEGDPPPLPFQRAIGHFNSRPHGGRRCPRTVQVGRFKFQLTPSRRATTRTILPATPRLHFNSRPHGGRPLLTIVFVCSGISTHALTEGDFILKYQDNIRFLFQLTPSRRATANLDKFFF